MKTTLYLGTDPTHFEASGRANGHVIHYPIIKIVPRSHEHPEIEQAFKTLHEYTHFLFTSKNAVAVFFHLVKDPLPLLSKILAIGEVTAMHLSAKGLLPTHVAKDETQEGMIALLESMNLHDAYLFIPRSSLSRPALTQFCEKNKIRYQACDLYDTITQYIEPKPDLNGIDEIVFTSPSTIAAFIEIFGEIPKGKKYLTSGPITREALEKYLK